MPKDQSTKAQVWPEEAQRRGNLVLRTLPILLIPLLTAVVSGLVLRFSLNTPPLPERPHDLPFAPLIPIVVVAVFLSSLIILVRLGRPTISALALIGGWTLITTMASLTNGITTFWPALLIIPICTAGLLLDGVASVSLAAVATILVASIGWLQRQQLMVPRFPNPFALTDQPIVAAAYWTGIFWTVAALTFLLAGALQRALQHSRAQADQLRALSAGLEERVQIQTAALLDQSRETATMEERARLARDIHDTIAQGLTGIVVQLGAAQRAMGAAPEEAAEHMELAQRMARESLAEARRSVWNLRSPALERGDLADALRGLAARPFHLGITGYFEQQGEPWLLPPRTDSALLRVAQEALANVAKHAGASEVRITLEYNSQDVRLHIRDNGRGFGDDVLAQGVVSSGPWGGFGLLGMRERLNALGGTLELTSTDGAHIVAIVPRKTFSANNESLAQQPLAELAASYPIGSKR